MEAFDFTASIGIDRRLYPYDIAGSQAHAKMLARIGVLTEEECSQIIEGLDEIRGEIEEGKFEWKTSREDIHMNIEGALVAKIGAAGEKLHTARSRNDQVAVDMRLWMRDQIAYTVACLRALQKVLVEQAIANKDIIVPGYTHLQRAQPVPLGHHLLAYVEMLDRDAGRFLDAADRANVCPLGAGAIGASTIPLDRDFVARELGFVDAQGKARLSRNSMDAVADRDFIAEFLAACALTSVHLSQMSEELILWSTVEFGFARIADELCTGSSLMPQKKNPDIPEIVRGKTGRVMGNLMSMLTTLKGLPLTYNYDLQEDKQALFDSADTVVDCVRIMTTVYKSLAFNAGRCEAAAADPQLLATDLVDWLVMKGVPFRSGHHIVGHLVGYCNEQGKELNQLSLEEMRQFSEVFDDSALGIFDLRGALDKRTIPGAPSFANVAEEAATWLTKLS